jgi:antibiotic biosynthesis monooxygenase (ABM) superfamily enzyme
VSQPSGPSGRLSRSRLTLVTWTAVYPLLTAMLFIGDPLFGGWPLPMRTLIVSAVLVPTLTCVIMPTAQRRLRRWLHTSPGR